MELHVYEVEAVSMLDGAQRYRYLTVANDERSAADSGPGLKNLRTGVTVTVVKDLGKVEALHIEAVL